MPLGLPVDAGRLADLCRRYHVAKLELFGSRAKGTARPDSDVDLLVTFEEGRTPGFAFMTLCDELADCFGREVDVLTRESVENDFNPYRRSGILEKTEALYAA
jgi:predicted nucleotidyltransferase